ncbi:anaphase-promoting complex subunit Cut9 [Coemansia sp. RSA 1804]|nr:anaphase-promoting complex subunit Cut9 [Coemansia sp. RSA 1804]
MSTTQNATTEVLAHLRELRASCTRGMAWCSALIWAEKAFLLSGDADDLLWLVDAFVTNGQFRQAEEWLLNPLYAAKCRATPQGRYLASVVAMRLGRAEEALELLSIDSIRYGGGLASSNSRRSGDLRYERPPPMFETPVAARTAARSEHETPTASLVSSLSISDHDNNDVATNTAQQQYMDTASKSQPRTQASGKTDVLPLNPRAWMLYMQGAAVIQLANVGGNEETPGIKTLSMRYPDASYLASSALDMGRTPTQRRSQGQQIARLGAIDSLVARLWVEALHADPRCWEAWSGIHEYGLLTSEEESQLVESLDWISSCAGSHVVARFFRDYCLATHTSFSLGTCTVDATARLLSVYPQLTGDPALRTIQAARLLALGCARESLEYTVTVLEQRRVPDPSATAIHITSLTVLHAKDALFRIAHELAEEFGISSIKRAEIEPADTVSSLPSIMSLGSGSGSFGSGFGSSVGIPMSLPRGTAAGAAVSGAGRVRSGARGLLIPETPSKGGAGAGFGGGGAATSGSLRRTGGSVQGVAGAIAQSSSAAATAAWRGLWGLPTWTHPGPPVMATYPCALGPTQSSAVSTEMSMSTLGTFTTTNAQSVGSPTQYEFIGASLAWYAIGCYYLVSATLATLPGVSQHEWPLAGMLYGAGFAAPASSHVGVGDSAVALRRSAPLSPEGEHALAEARRWLAKTTLASPRSIVAWVAFAHTFVISREWESATRALHTAVGLCGCEGIIHSGGRDSESAAPAMPPQMRSKRTKRSEDTPSFDADSSDSSSGNNGPSNKSGGYADGRAGGSDFERGSLLAHAPLASLGSVYLQMGDLAMAESCFDASARCLSGRHISGWLAAWSAVLEPLENADILTWSSDEKRVCSDEIGRIPTSHIDPQLLNDVGVLYYNRGAYAKARLAFALALAALHTKSRVQRSLNMAFNDPLPNRRANSKLSPELRAYLALLSANLGSTLRKLGDYTAALICLRSAIELAPYSMSIQLSVAFTLHQRAIDCYHDPDYDSNVDLDKAIDAYHRILAEHPGDPVITDLLTLALELSNSLQDILSLSNILGIDGVPDLDSETFELKDPSEMGLFGPLGSARGNMDDDSGSHSSSKNSAQTPHAAEDGGPTLSQSGASSSDEDSDEVMDIEEDSNDNSESDSDMAMD